MFHTPFENTQYALAQLGQEMKNDFNMANSDVVCLKCKTTLKSFLDTGFVGCSRCYEAFKPYSRSLAMDIHGRVNHIGKVPKAEVTKASKKREIERLKQEENNAVLAKEYLIADGINKQIQRLMEEIK